MVNDEELNPKITRDFSISPLRAGVIFNVLFVALSWIPSFEGDENHAGEVDRLLDKLRIGGFRIDVIWLLFSTASLVLVFLYLLTQIRDHRSARLNAAFCAAGIVAFILFAFRIVNTGLLDFG